MFIASLAIFPTSEGASVSRYVKEVIRIIEDSGLNNQTGGMNTTIESPDLESLFKVIQKAHDKLVKMDVSRIRIELSVDHRLDKKGSISQKLGSLE
jgi:uncharacterized protein (TIGR00106 family)